MPGSLVEPAKRDADQDANKSRDKVGRTSQDEGDGPVESKASNHAWEGVVETACAEMHVLHQAEQVESWVSDRLGKACTSIFARCKADSVSENAVMGQLSLLVLEPPCGQREIWQKIHSEYGDSKCNGAIDDEEPFLARDTMNVVEGAECGSGDETREGRRQDVAQIQDRHRGSDFLTGIEERKEVNGTVPDVSNGLMTPHDSVHLPGIVRSFGDTEEKSRNDKSCIIVCKSSAG